MKMKTSRVVILMIIAILLAIYILFPFFLVLLNSFKNQAAIVQDPISAAGASFSQFVSNVNAVVITRTSCSGVPSVPRRW